MVYSHESDFTRFYNDHNSWLNTWLRRRLGNRADAADLAQDTFLRLLKRDREGIVVEQPRAYITRIARGLMINHWRRQDIERAWQEALLSQPEAVALSAEEQHLIMETLLEVDAMLRALPAKVRQAFLMSRLDGYHYRDIGAAMGVSERMVKKYMAQAMYHCLLLDDH